MSHQYQRDRPKVIVPSWPPPPAPAALGPFGSSLHILTHSINAHTFVLSLSPAGLPASPQAMSPPPTGHKQSSLNGYSRRKRNFSPTQQNESLSPPVDPAISPDHAGNSTAESGSSRLTGGEDNLTLRRREANRLAAQRFRSRKKGYQDSLEERIRVLEEEKDIMARSMGQPLRQEYYPPPRSASPEKGPIDVDVRVAALESANRRLQDELRVIAEDNDRLRDEVDRWRQWEREVRMLPELCLHLVSSSSDPCSSGFWSGAIVPRSSISRTGTFLFLSSPLPWTSSSTIASSPSPNSPILCPFSSRFAGISTQGPRS